MSTPVRALGVWSATALVVGNMIGSGVFLLPASLAQYGSASVLGWLLSTAGALLLAIVLMQGRSIPPRASAAFGRLAMIFVAYNLANSLRPGISMAAHIGGHAVIVSEGTLRL